MRAVKRVGHPGRSAACTKGGRRVRQDSGSGHHSGDAAPPDSIQGMGPAHHSGRGRPRPQARAHAGGRRRHLLCRHCSRSLLGRASGPPLGRCRDRLSSRLLCRLLRCRLGRRTAAAAPLLGGSGGRGGGFHRRHSRLSLVFCHCARGGGTCGLAGRTGHPRCAGPRLRRCPGARLGLFGAGGRGGGRQRQEARCGGLVVGIPSPGRRKGGRGRAMRGGHQTGMPAARGRRKGERRPSCRARCCAATNATAPRPWQPQDAHKPPCKPPC